MSLTALCCYPLEEILGNGFIWSFQWFDEDDALVWLGFLGVETLDSKRHLVDQNELPDIAGLLGQRLLCLTV